MIAGYLKAPWNVSISCLSNYALDPCIGMPGVHFLSGGSVQYAGDRERAFLNNNVLLAWNRH